MVTVERQYHSWFHCDRSNANRFFLFGQRFRLCKEEHVSMDTELRQSNIAFMEMGRDRNHLVPLHSDYDSLAVSG